MSGVDAIVIGGGPNGVAAAIELQRHGVQVLLVEANERVGGAARTEACTLPGFLHDVGSAVYPLGIGSPFFSSLPLEAHGLHWSQPETPLAHPLESGRTAFLERSLEATADRLGPDGEAYRALVSPFVARWPAFVDHVLDTPLRPPTSPGLMARFAPLALRPTTALARRFTTGAGRALLAGNAAHSGVPLETRLTGAIGVTLMAAAHAVGWPVPRGGAGRLTAALADHFIALGGAIETGRRVGSLDELPECRATILALTLRQVGQVAGDRLDARWRRASTRWRYGPGAFKVDWALDGPIPWREERVGHAGTVHVGGTLEEIAASERAVAAGRLPERPFVLLAQPTVCDPTRAPEGRHVGWAYCHVPNGWSGDATGAIEAQVERHAPGFRDRILSRAVWPPSRLEAGDANLGGGDVTGGGATL